MAKKSSSDRAASESSHKKEAETDGSGRLAAGQAAPYVVLARKYRPQSFADLIGQEAMVRTLTNAFAAGRIAQGYMLTGVRGVGKTTTARILARGFNYSREGAPDAPSIVMAERGAHCDAIMEGRHPDVVEMDAASNTSVDNVREIIESARYRPLVARYKVFIIDEVHMLSKGAFNALLKTLEEPPEHVKFIFATTEIRKVPVTVLSRCQRFDLRRVGVPELTAHLARVAAGEAAQTEDEALRLIARAAEGSVRDALSVLDQAIAMGEGRVTGVAVRAMLGLADRGRLFDLLENLFRGGVASALDLFSALYRDGADPAHLLADLAEAVHVAARRKIAGSAAETDQLSAEEKRRAADLAESLSVPVLSRAYQVLLKGAEEAARAPSPAAAAEMVLIRLAHAADLPSPEDLIKSLTDSSSETKKRGSDERAGVREREPATLELTSSSIDDAPDVRDGRPAAAPRTFAELLDLVGREREAALKVHLEEHVSLVKFDATACSIDLFLLAGAPASLANELREKLVRWTGQRWIVLLSPTPGERPAGPAKREAAAAEKSKLAEHPAVAAVLEAFPGAKIVEIRPSGDAAGQQPATVQPARRPAFK